MTGPHTILGIFPHPDDEAYTAAGTLALAAANGHAVHLLCATKGEAGQSSDPALSTPEKLAERRAEELARSCAAIGAQPPHFLNYRDGRLEAVDVPEAVGRIVTVIRAVRPDVVVTLGPDGVYGHPDHIALHKLVTPAFRSAGGGDRFPSEQFGEPWQPARLLWVAFPLAHFRPVWERLLTTDLAEGVRRFNPNRLGVTPDQMHLTVDVSAVQTHKLAAMAAHASQLADGDPLSIFPPGILAPLLHVERFTLAMGTPFPAGAGDVFSGL